MFARRFLLLHPSWPDTCVFTRTRDRTSVMCARSAFVKLVICKLTCVFTRTRNRMSAMCAMKLFVNLNICKPTSLLTRRRNRINVSCARRVLVNLVVCKATCAFIISSAFSCSVIYYRSPRCLHIMHRCTFISRRNRRKFPLLFITSK